VAQPDGQEDQGPLSPLVRKMAREYNIDLGQVKGTGAGGRITKQDMESFMSSQAARTYAAPSAPPEPVPTAAGPYPIEPPPQTPPQPARQAHAAPPAPPQQAPAPQPLPIPESARTRTEPMSVMRQKIAEH